MLLRVLLSQIDAYLNTYGPAQAISTNLLKRIILMSRGGRSIEETHWDSISSNHAILPYIKRIIDACPQ